jgi:hypothetical protein
LPGGHRWSEDLMTREMLNLDLHRGDVSLVALAANPSTRGATMMTMPGVGGWSASWQPHGSQRAAAATEGHGPYSGTHTHPHPAFGSQGDDQSHSHEHAHDNDADHHHSHGEDRAAHRAQGEIADISSSPDFNLPSTSQPYDAGAHSWKPSIGCPNKNCPVYANGDGQAQNELDSDYCDQCGGPLYNSDGLIVLDDSGVVEEVGGAMADADLLMRTRMLELA